MDKKRLILSLIRIILGCTFISSAVLKLLSVETFAYYVYTFEWFGFIIASILSRLLIICEFVLGVFLILKIFYKFSWWSSLVMLSSFSIFLIYLAIFRADENCHCFGDFIELAPLPSLIKNIVMMTALFFIRKQEEWHHPSKPFLIATSFVIAIAFTFIFFPINELRFKQDAFEKYILQSKYAYIVDSSQNEIIGFVSAACSHCKEGNTKMQKIFSEYNLDKSRFRNLVWASNDSTLQKFKDTTNTNDFMYIKIEPDTLIDINYGIFPTYVFFEKGRPVKAINYKEVRASDVIDFIND